MGRRPTIQDLAENAGVSVATVDRVLNRRLPVRESTALRVVSAAEAIGYHATGLLKQPMTEVPARTFGFLLQTRHDEFYRRFGAELAEATRRAPFIRGRALVEFMDGIAPAAVARHILDMGSRAAALAVVAVDHPLVNEAIATVSAKGKHVFTLLSDVTAPERAGYLAADSRKSGRIAAWMIARLARQPGKIGIVLGSHRYLSQELCEISFRSYMREHAPHFQLLEPLLTLDDEKIAYDAVSHLIAGNPDLVGIYVAGGGQDGLIRALRDQGAQHRIVAICNELIEPARAALIDGTVDMVLDTPIAEISARAVEVMAKACGGESLQGLSQILIPAKITISENL